MLIFSISDLFLSAFQPFSLYGEQWSSFHILYTAYPLPRPPSCLPPWNWVLCLRLQANFGVGSQSCSGPQRLFVASQCPAVLQVSLETKPMGACRSQKKRYRSCHWCGAFSKDAALYLKSAY